MDRNPIKFGFLVLLASACCRLRFGGSLTRRRCPRHPSSLRFLRLRAAMDRSPTASWFNACFRDSGRFAGRVTNVHRWPGKKDTWAYTITRVREISGPVRRKNGSVYYVEGNPGATIGPVSHFSVTDGKCPDGRP